MQSNQPLGTASLLPSYRDNVSSPVSVGEWLLPGFREPVAFNELGTGPGDRDQGISSPVTKRMGWQLPRDDGNFVQDTGTSELAAGCQGSRADAPAAQSLGTSNSMTSEPLDN